MTFKEYSYLICGIIYLIYLVYILFNKLFQDIPEEELMIDPRPWLHSIRNHPAIFFGGMGMIWTIIGLFTSLWFLFALLIITRLVYLLFPFKDREQDIRQYKISTLIEIILVIAILILMFIQNE